METSKRDQFQAIKGAVLRACQDPGKLRAIVITTISVLGFVLYCNPQAGRLAEVSKKLKKAQEKARYAKECRHFVEQARLFEPRCPKTDDVGDWQDYIMGCVGAAGAKMRKLEPRRGLMKGKYRIVLLELEADGMYDNIVDLIDRLERGERIVRLDRLALEKKPGRVSFRCVVMGLVKLRA